MLCKAGPRFLGSDLVCFCKWRYNYFEILMHFSVHYLQQRNPNRQKINKRKVEFQFSYNCKFMNDANDYDKGK